MEFSPSLKWSEGNLRIWRGIKTNKNLRLKPAISHPRACATITDAELIQIPAGLMAHTSVRYSGPQGPATSCSGFTILMCMLGWFITSGPGERLTPVLSLSADRSQRGRTEKMKSLIFLCKTRLDHSLEEAKESDWNSGQLINNCCKTQTASLCSIPPSFIAS